MSDIVIYENGEVALSATVENETIWLSQKQMAELFNKSVKTINDHIGNIFEEGELEKKSTIRKYRIVQMEGKREVERETNFYTLDVIISVGYRVKSKEGTKFRIWANSVNDLSQKDILKNLEQSVNEMNRIKEGRVEAMDVRSLLNELS